MSIQKILNFVLMNGWILNQLTKFKFFLHKGAT